MSSAFLALSRAKSCRRSRSECLGWIPAFDPVLKNRSMPPCRKDFITRLLYSVTIRDVKGFNDQAAADVAAFILSSMAWANSAVFALPPRSRVMCLPSTNTAKSAVSILPAASRSPM